MKKILCFVIALVCALGLASCKDKASETDSAVAFYVEYNGAKIELGAQADKIIERLGEPQSVREIGDCGGLGAQVKYSYPSLYVYVLESNTKGNVIDQITFRDDVVITPEGVYIGMSAEDAKQKLGEPTAQSDTSLEYVKGSFILRLVIKNSAVEQIDYMTDTQ